MTALAFLLGFLVPALAGWLIVTRTEGRTAVLLRAERIALGLLFGLDLVALGAFWITFATGSPLTLSTFLFAPAATILILGARAWTHRPSRSAEPPPSPRPPRLAAFLLAVLSALAMAKILFAGVTFLFLTPTYLDDTLDNWNLRGKVYFVDQAMTLALPKEDPVESVRSISSYPPMVPLIKAWLASLAGEWNEPLINAPHLAWFGIVLVLLYCSLRRATTIGWAALGTYALAALPLYVMHGTNPYADVFVSVHVFAAISLLYHAGRQSDTVRAHAFLRLAGLAGALLPFTKNEGLLVFLPPLLLLAGWTLWRLSVRKILTRADLLRTLLWFALPLLAVAGPWLAFKWMNGMTFGNAKPFTSLGFGWQQGVVIAIVINTFFEGNWLLLFPLLFALLALRWRAAFTRHLALTAYFAVIYFGQIFLYLFTGLAVEARMQTGYARGLVQLAPTIVLLATMLLWEGRETFADMWTAMTGRKASE